MTGGAREGRQLGGHQGEVEGTVSAQLGGPLDHTGKALEATGLFVAGAQMGPSGGWEPAVHLVEAAAGPDRGQGGGQGSLPGGGVVDVVGGDHLDPGPKGEGGQRVVADRIERVAMVPELNRHVLPPEDLDESGQRGLGRRRALTGQRGGHGALATAGQHQPVTPGCSGRLVGQVRQRATGRPLLSRHLGPADDRPQPGVANRVAGQHQQMGTAGIGHTVGYGCGPEGQLGAEHRGQALGPGRLGEPHHAVEAVVVGEGQGVQPQMHGLLDQFLGMGRTVEEAEVGMTVQLGVGRSRDAPFDRRGLVGPPLAGPGRAVTTIAFGPGRSGGAAARTGRQPALQLTPRHVRIAPPHAWRTVPNTCSLCTSLRREERTTRSVEGSHRLFEGPSRHAPSANHRR